MPNTFPHDIIIDILSKVEVKSFLKFKTVCKSWYSLINDNKFIKQHYNTRGGDKTGQKYFFAFSEGPNRKQYYYTIDPPLHHDSSLSLLEPPAIPLKIQSQLIYDMHYYSSNGMILITYQNDDTIILWNPAIRESRIIPSPMLNKSAGFGLKRLYNVCYVPSMDDYKIVRVGQKSHEGDYDFEIFSTKSNSWELIDTLSQCEYFVDPAQQVVIVDGIVYMIMWTNYKNLSTNRVVYDYTIERYCLKIEEFQDDLLFPYRIQGKDIKPTLFVLGENLCLTKYLLNEGWTWTLEYYEVWCMKKNDLSDPWIKILSVRPINGLLRPVNFTKNGDILFRKDGKDFVVYNSERDIFEIIEVVGLEARPFFRTAITFVESLFSPYKS